MDRGLFVVVDGLDGVGKGEVERALIGVDQKSGRSVFDSIAWSMANEKGRPELSDFWNPSGVHYNTLVTAEPTYSCLGKDIRQELTSNAHDRKYPLDVIIQAYSIDRLIQMKRAVIPARENGLNVIQSRCFGATLCYESLMGRKEGWGMDDVRDMILQQEGSRIEIEHNPDLLIIPTIYDIDELMKRIESRGKSRKDDKSIFENAEFQSSIKPYYESKWFRKIFEDAGSRVAYLNAGISESSTREQAVDIYRNFLASGDVPNEYKTPDFS